jgi:uncharacterized protein (DUF2249 family)/CRP-like cAMP-binding protein
LRRISPGSHGPRTVKLDVRRLPQWQRHPAIFAAFDGLDPDDVLVLVNDHEPRPLRVQLEDLRPGEFAWTAFNRGDERWETEIRRLAMPSASGSDDEAIAGLLRRCSLTVDANPATRAVLAEQAVVKRLRNGDRLVAQGYAWPFVAIVGAGTLAVVAVSPGGRENLLFEVLPLETFGELSALDEGVTVGSPHVISPEAWVAVVPRASFQRALHDDPALARACALACALRSRVLAERLTAQVSQTTVARIAAAILPYAPPQRGLTAALAPLDTLTVVHIAIAAGTVREVVSRTLATLARAGAIERRNGRIVRVDREVLLTFL